MILNPEKYVLILGEDELSQGTVTVKEMATGEQKVLPKEELLETLHGKLTGGK